ncbi:MAG: phosphopantetheine-binding protein [Actinomycetota bacterium]|nr:phosphopantetheine-binding protein [Actinomycetota bacterium]MDP2288365.1 phosphopantetheine-binding protein [Actinomycetota bacterium]
MIDEVELALTRVLGHPVTLRADTPLENLGHWPLIAVLVARALRESTGISLSDRQLQDVQTAGELAVALESARP